MSTLLGRKVAWYYNFPDRSTPFIYWSAEDWPRRNTVAGKQNWGVAPVDGTAVFTCLGNETFIPAAPTPAGAYTAPTVPANSNAPHPGIITTVLPTQIIVTSALANIVMAGDIADPKGFNGFSIAVTDDPPVIITGAVLNSATTVKEANGSALSAGRFVVFPSASPVVPHVNQNGLLVDLRGLSFGASGNITLDLTFA